MGHGLSWFETALAPLHHEENFFCGRAVDERDVSLTASAANLRVGLNTRCAATHAA
jgi:hypothetical protein